MDVKKKPFRFDQNKSCQTAKEGGWHIFHSVHGCQQWWFIREEKKKEKKTAEEVTYMVRENERERSAGSGFYLWFIYVPLSGFLPPTPIEDSHWMREMYLTGRSALAYYFHVMWRAVLGKQADVCFSPLSFLNESVDIFALCTWRTRRAVSQNHSQSHQMCPSSTAVLQRASQNSSSHRLANAVCVHICLIKIEMYLRGDAWCFKMFMHYNFLRNNHHGCVCWGLIGAGIKI